MAAPPPQPGVLYGCVCQGTHINAEAGTIPSKVTLKAFIDGTVQGPFANRDKASFNHDVCSYNYIKATSGFTFIAVAPKEVDTRIVYEFLGEMMREFEVGSDRETYEQRVKVLLSQYATPRSSIQRHQEMLDATKATMQDTVNKMAANAATLDATEEAVTGFEVQTQDLAKKSHDVKVCAKWKAWRLRIIICVILIVVLFVVLIAACGGFSFPKCGGDSGGGGTNINVNLPPTAPTTPTAPTSTTA